MTKEAVNEIAQGRVWTGEDALKLGLIDVLGGLEDAIAIAAQSRSEQLPDHPNYRLNAVLSRISC